MPGRFSHRLLPLARYLNEVGAIERLTPDQEIELGLKPETSENDDLCQRGIAGGEFRALTK